jgi:hypothetical protein
MLAFFRINHHGHHDRSTESKSSENGDAPQQLTSTSGRSQDLAALTAYQAPPVRLRASDNPGIAPKPMFETAEAEINHLNELLTHKSLAKKNHKYLGYKVRYGATISGLEADVKTKAGQCVVYNYCDIRNRMVIYSTKENSQVVVKRAYIDAKGTVLLPKSDEPQSITKFLAKEWGDLPDAN